VRQLHITCTEPQETLAMDHRDDARARELNNLRLALATFALQLDAFEMRTSGASSKAGLKAGFKTGSKAGTKSGIPAPPPDINYRLQKEKIIGGQ
jgi:hypothetical protein